MALQDFGQATAIIKCLGMVLNIVLARFSRMHYIFLTGHHTFYMAAMLAIILHIGGLDGWMLYISSACLLGLIMVLSPAYCQPTMRKVTGSDSVALGHFGGVGYWLSGMVGKLFASDRENSTEKLQFSKRLIFLRDNTVSIGLTMIIMFLIITGVAVGRGLLGAVPAGISAAEFASNPAYAGFQHLGDLLNVGTETTTNWVVWAFLRDLSFAGDVYIILSGVRLIIGEIVQAFKVCREVA